MADEIDWTYMRVPRDTAQRLHEIKERDRVPGVRPSVGRVVAQLLDLAETADDPVLAAIRGADLGSLFSLAGLAASDVHLGRRRSASVDCNLLFRLGVLAMAEIASRSAGNPEDYVGLLEGLPQSDVENALNESGRDHVYAEQLRAHSDSALTLYLNSIRRAPRVLVAEMLKYSTRNLKRLRAAREQS